MVDKRHYRLRNLDFRDFWDICSHFQRTHQEFTGISYTVEGKAGLILAGEWDVAVVLKKLAASRDEIRKIAARFYRTEEDFDFDRTDTQLVYLPDKFQGLESGLHYFTESFSKLKTYHFESVLYANYDLQPPVPEIEAEFGHPCEILAAIVDMRGFTAFCEQPTIESPYTCGLMSAFYSMISSGFCRYQPDLMKYLGDGVLAIWETSPGDRDIAIETCLEGISNFNRRWNEIRKGPQFTHGAPKDIGSGVSFGLASRLSVGNDYIGRPINLASRLCGVCQPGQALIDKSVPNVSADARTKEIKVRIKSFGDYPVWSLLIT